MCWFRTGDYWDPILHEAVNKHDLSTGETGGLVPENVGFELNHGVERAPPICHISNRRESCLRKNQWNVADTGEVSDRRCCQDNGRVQFGRGSCGSPKSKVSNLFSQGLLTFSGLMARQSGLIATATNRGRCLSDCTEDPGWRCRLAKEREASLESLRAKTNSSHSRP